MWTIARTEDEINVKMNAAAAAGEAGDPRALAWEDAILWISGVRRNSDYAFDEVRDA